MKTPPVPPPTHPWPFLRRYRGPCLDRIVLPVGGIGTGTVGLAGNGALRDWEVMNVPAKGYVPSFRGELKTPTPSLLLRFQERGRPPGIKVLEGPVPLSGYEAAEGSEVPNANLPRFRRAEFATAYPFGEVHLRDACCPLAVRLQAFNPFVPGDAELSGFPVAFFRCVLTNSGRHPVPASVAFSLPNFIGADGSAWTDNAHSGHHDTVGCQRNRNAWRVLGGGSHAGLFLDSAGVDPADLAWGTLSLTTPLGPGLSHRAAWADVGWGDMLLARSRRGRRSRSPFSWPGISRIVSAGGTREKWATAASAIITPPVRPGAGQWGRPPGLERFFLRCPRASRGLQPGGNPFLDLSVGLGHRPRGVRAESRALGDAGRGGGDQGGPAGLAGESLPRHRPADGQAGNVLEMRIPFIRCRLPVILRLAW